MLVKQQQQQPSRYQRHPRAGPVRGVFRRNQGCCIRDMPPIRAPDPSTNLPNQSRGRTRGILDTNRTRPTTNHNLSGSLQWLDKRKARWGCGCGLRC
mmetsp:Transcript_23630/g.45015  ORF Transcript_23630/g.45015 Transcript_23630/m.45015 type:complete len:97 (-) Transcript_23630:840-1130(-)